MEQINNETFVGGEDSQTERKKRESRRENAGVKLLVISLLCLLLLIPWMLIRSTISERSNTELDAENEVSAKWGGSQLVKGPAIHVGATEKELGFLLLPDTLDIESNASCRSLNRGIYDFTVYDATVVAKGCFMLPRSINAAQLDRLEQNCWNMEMELGSLKGLADNPQVKINGEPLAVQEISFEGSRIIWNVDLTQMLAGESIDYEVTINLKGSRRLDFLPTGNTTTVRMTSDCVTPSFGGGYLPIERDVRDDGFDAEWRVLAINRSFSQVVPESVWKSLDAETSYVLWEEDGGGQTFGVELRQPVKQYQQNERAVKYAYVIVLLTFAIVFFVEMRRGVAIHPVQYLLVGVAIMLFYALLLSMSEHLSFLVAYIIATVMTVGLLASYLGGVMRDRKVGLLLGAILLVCYLFIYILLQIESYALLVGSVGLFVILAVVMAASRKVEWYKQNNS